MVILHIRSMFSCFLNPSLDSTKSWLDRWLTTGSQNTIVDWASDRDVLCSQKNLKNIRDTCAAIWRSETIFRLKFNSMMSFPRIVWNTVQFKEIHIHNSNVSICWDVDFFEAPNTCSTHSCAHTPDLHIKFTEAALEDAAMLSCPCCGWWQSNRWQLHKMTTIHRRKKSYHHKFVNSPKNHLKVPPDFSGDRGGRVLRTKIF